MARIIAMVVAAIIATVGMFALYPESAARLFGG